MRKNIARRGALRRALLSLFVLAASLGSALGTVPGPVGAAPAPPTPPVAPDRPLVFTYYYYWYDSTTGMHLREEEGLSQHFPAQPAPTWRGTAWHKQQLADMAYAGIDVTLPVYWGFDRPDDAWSTQGLSTLADAWRALKAEGKTPPQIGMFFDTAFLDRRDLTTAAGRAYFYANFKDFFGRIPREQWAMVNGRPIVYLFTSDFIGAFNQGTFDYVYSQFQADFGVRPYIVREMSWDYPFSGWTGSERNWDYSTPIRTDNSYLWAAAIFAYRAGAGVAAVGPGYDDTRIPGRPGWVTPRWDGAVYRWALDTALASDKPWLAIETWNEFHEGSGIAESTEYGRQYLDITREYTARFKASRATVASVSAPPEATVAPTTLDFGNQRLGTTSAAKTVALTNGGGAALSISGITTSGDFAQTNNCGSSLAAGASCTVSVTFAPTASGNRSGSLRLAHNADTNPTTVALAGAGTTPTAPSVSLSATSLGFGNQSVGSASAPQAVTLTNTGTGTLTIGGIAASGDFSQANSCGGSVAPGANCTISVTFTPTAGGNRTGALTITDNAGGSPRTIALAGSGVAPAASLSVTSLNFGIQWVGTTSGAKTVTLKNTGTGTLNIASIAVSGDFARTTTCGSTLAPGASCAINVTFKPTARGTRTGTLTITDNAGGSPRRIPVTGNGY